MTVFGPSTSSATQTSSMPSPLVFRRPFAVVSGDREPLTTVETQPDVTHLKQTSPDAVAGAAESFDEFFRREYPRAVKLAWLLTRSRAAAEDTAQDAMVGVHDRFATLDSPSASLTRVVINRCR